MSKTRNSYEAFQNCERGTVAIIFAAALVVIFGGLAAAIDLSYTATVSSDVRHVGKSICGRAASALIRGKSVEQAAELSKDLGNELITKTSLKNKKTAFNVNINGATGQVTVDGKATVMTPFISLFGVNSLRPTDAIQCDGPAPPPPPPAEPPANSGGNCGGQLPSSIAPQWAAVNNGAGSSTTGYNSTTAGSQSSQSNGEGSRSGSNGSFSGGQGSTQGSTTTSQAGANSLSCSQVSNGNSSGSGFSYASAQGPGATAQSSTNATVSGNSGAGSGGGAAFSGPGGGPASGGGGGKFCVGSGC